MILSRRKVRGGERSAPQLGLVSYPDAGGVGISTEVPQWLPMSVVSHPQQKGRYGTHIPTQIPSYWPDAQMRCGVEAIEVHWQVFSAGDRPYYFTQPFPQNPRRTLRDGGRAGQVQGPGSLAPVLGPGRRANAQSLQSLSASLLGW